MMDEYRTLVTFQDNYMPGPRLVKHLMNTPRQGDEVIIDSNVFIVKRVRTRYKANTTMPTALVNMERVGSTGEDGW